MTAHENDRFAFGIDLSRWNSSDKHQVDFDVIAQHVPMVSFIGMRAGISWGYQDPWFAYYLHHTQRINAVPLPYHVLYPGESAARQMDNFFRIVGDVNYEQTPMVLDLELDHGQTRDRITQTTAQALSIIQSRTNRIPIIYCRTSWVRQFIITERLPPVHWWLAQYRWPTPYPLYTPEYPCPPKPLPPGANTWLIHQTASRGKSIGAKAMHFMDYNRWNGTIADIHNFVGLPPLEPVTCPIDGADCPRLMKEKYVA
jgi:GH25 family lysozyme M1 (1,4-beta-N-acetylmuramidase)